MHLKNLIIEDSRSRTHNLSLNLFGGNYVIINAYNQAELPFVQSSFQPQKNPSSSLFSFPDQKKQSPLPSYETLLALPIPQLTLRSSWNIFTITIPLFYNMLHDIKVLEFEGLAPTLFCGMYFADQGAQVVLVARENPAPFSIPVNQNLMNRGKKLIILSPKIQKQKQTIMQLIASSDIIIDPYRPGVLEKLNLGPDLIFKVNRKAILLRVSGYGQSGPIHLKPGHDLNYISTSGIVPLINANNSQRVSEFPTNYLADFVSCSLGITATLAALTISKMTGVGRVVDCSMTDGCRYFTKIISEPQKNDVNVLQPQFIQWDGCEYLILSKLKEEKKFMQLIEQMSKQGISHIKDGEIKITRIQSLPELEKSIKGLKNPFDNNFNEAERQLPLKNFNPEEIMNLLKIADVKKSKL